MAGDGLFDSIVTTRDPERVIDLLRKLSKRGKLPGFETECPGLFRVAAFGAPFDHHLTCYASAAEEGTELRFVLERQKRLPLIFAATLVFTVWPGVYLTDSFLSTIWEAYGRWTLDMPWLTYAWYLPITAGPIPWMWGGWSKKSRAAADEHGREQVDKIRKALEAE
ncbi:MAG: hypothetical protein AAF108_07100 [Planctomycetota bacterium]